MSVKELKLIDVIGIELYVKFKDNEFELKLHDESGRYLWLDRNQAHLLMLYLQEHLNVHSG